MLKHLSLATLTTLALSGCVLDDSDSDEIEQASFVITPIAKTLNSDPLYSISMSSNDVNVSNGYAQLTIQITDNNADALPDSQVSITPNMLMVSGMEHGTPISNASGNLDDSGEFTSTAYFLMPSSMNGTKMGDWTFTVEFGGESQDFLVELDGMSDMQKLQGAGDDLIPSGMTEMGGMTEMDMTKRSYYMFNRGRMVMENMNSFEVYISARESMMSYSAVSEGVTLNTGEMNSALAINEVTVEMCNATETADCESGSVNWVMAMAVNGQEGVYKAMNLGLTGDETDSVQVRLSVNGIEKLKGDDSRATFSFASMDMDMAM